jgi:hypothetical protein
MATEVFQLSKKGAMSHFFWKSFDNSWQELSKKYDKPPFVVIENNLVPIQKIMTLGWVNEEI